jgi:hypothetical protein
LRKKEKKIRGKENILCSACSSPVSNLGRKSFERKCNPKKRKGGKKIKYTLFSCSSPMSNPGGKSLRENVFGIPCCPLIKNTL